MKILPVQKFKKNNNPLSFKGHQIIYLENIAKPEQIPAVINRVYEKIGNGYVKKFFICDGINYETKIFVGLLPSKNSSKKIFNRLAIATCDDCYSNSTAGVNVTRAKMNYIDYNIFGHVRQIFKELKIKNQKEVVEIKYGNTGGIEHYSNGVVINLVPNENILEKYFFALPFNYDKKHNFGQFCSPDLNYEEIKNYGRIEKNLPPRYTVINKMFR